jgi:hypothetical protein
MKNWQAIAERQALIIENLSLLCCDLTSELAQYKNIDEEEKHPAELEAR